MNDDSLSATAESARAPAPNGSELFRDLLEQEIALLERVTRGVAAAADVDAAFRMVLDRAAAMVLEAEGERRRLAQMVEQVGEAIIVHSVEDGVITFWNRGAERLYGWTREEAVGRRIAELLRTEFPGPTEEIRSGIESAGAWTGELRHTRRDGGPAIVESSWTLLRQHDGSRAVLEINSDVTERERFQGVLEMAKDAAEAATRAKSEFLANMSHEIRTPMNGIIGMTELLLDTPLAPEQREYVELVRGSADSLLRIINDILDFSRIEAGKLTLDSRPFPVHKAFGDVLRTLAVRARDKGIELEHRIRPTVPTALVGDIGRLEQVLINLVSNAIKFTDRGRVFVDVDAQEDGPAVRLWVSVHDTGIGIRRERRAAIFEAFTQADASTTRRYGGTGLGLSISSQLIQLMGGRIWVESELGRGSTFSFTVRLERASATEAGVAPMEAVPVMPVTSTPKSAGSPAASPDAAAADASAPAPAPAQNTAGSLRILIAEDNPVNQRLARAILEKAGHTVAAAATGVEALAMLERERFDAVLMDVQMPDLGGLQATSILRRRERAGGTRHMPVIAVTAHAMAGDRERCLAAGMDAYVAKPLRPAELMEALAQVVPRPARASADDDGPAALDEDLRARLLARVDGDPALLAELAGLFVSDATQARAELRARLDAGEAERMYRAAHRLKGAAGALGAEEVAEAAGRLEALGREGDLTAAPAALAELEIRLDRLLVTLRALAGTPADA